MAEEDMIFGKNRHLFGGIEPSNMISFNATSVYSGGKDSVVILAELPLDTTVEGQQLCTVAGAVIRRRTTGFPADEFDGTLIADITADSGIQSYFQNVDTDVVPGQTYYYAAFPYTKQGVYNRSNANRSSCTVGTYFFGFDINLTDSNPDTRVSYPSDVDNASFVAARMNFTTGIFNYGSWPSTPGERFMPRPCMLTYAGVVDHYLNPNDYTKKVDNTVSSVNNPDFGGNAMMEWPKIFTKRWVDASGIYHFRCCNTALDASYECWSNYDKNNKKIDHFYTPIYFGSSISGRMRSLSGHSESVLDTADLEISLARANGDDWYTEVLADRLLIQDLLVMMAKTTDCQTAFGFGRSKFDLSDPIGLGTMDDKGMFWGSNDQISGVKVFGMENWWGNLSRRTAGWILNKGVQKVKLTRGTKDGSTASDYNIDGSGYLTVADATPSGSTGGYISSMKTEAFGRLPVTASGSSSTYEADGMWFDNSGITYALVGGYWRSDLLTGPFYTDLTAEATMSCTAIGAALSCKPLAS